MKLNVPPISSPTKIEYYKIWDAIRYYKIAVVKSFHASFINALALTILATS